MYKRSTNKFSFIQPNEKGRYMDLHFLEFIGYSTIFFKSQQLFSNQMVYIFLNQHLSSWFTILINVDIAKW